MCIDVHVYMYRGISCSHGFLSILKNTVQIYIYMYIYMHIDICIGIITILRVHSCVHLLWSMYMRAPPSPPSFCFLFF